MAPRRKPPEPGGTNRVSLRLPTDVFERIEAKAKGEGRPFHRIIVNELTLFPHLDRQTRLGELVRDMESVLARYASRIAVTDLNGALLHAVDGALAARTDGQLRPQLDLLRVIRSTMLESERRAATHEGKQGDRGAAGDVAGQGAFAGLKACYKSSLPASARNEDGL